MIRKTLKRGAVIGAICFVAAGGVASAAPAAPVAPPALNVAAAQSGTWNVGVTSAPLWQGTPYVSSRVLLDISGGPSCQDLDAIPADKTLFVTNVVTEFNMPPGNAGNAELGFTPLGGSPTFVDLPAQRTAPATQVVGLYDQYTGSLALGMPVTSTSVCFGGGPKLNGKVTVLGFLVPKP